MKRFLCEVKNRWQNYKYRFVPWQIFNWQRERTGVRRVEKSVDFKIGQEDDVCEHLKYLFENYYDAEARNESCNDAMFKSFGFNLEKRTSSIKGAGDGVFVSRGVIHKDSVAAMYPGTIYYPSDPLLFQSINNPFILRCIDGIMIDGNHRGISRLIYRSCCGRDMIGPYKPCDTSWLIDAVKNPLAIGQFVNNQTTDRSANVAYQEINIPISFPLHLRKYLPNIYYSSRFAGNTSDASGVHDSPDVILMRVVVLLSTAEINVNEELFSSYFTEVV